MRPSGTYSGIFLSVGGSSHDKMVILDFLSCLSSTHRLGTAWLFVHSPPQAPSGGHPIPSVLQTRDPRLRGSGSRLHSTIHPSPPSMKELGRRAGQLQATLSQRCPRRLPPDIRCGHVQAGFPAEKSEVMGAMLARSFGNGSPGLGLFPLLPMTWQMDVRQLPFNHEKTRTTPGGCPTRLDCSPQTLRSSLIRGISSLFVTAT